MNSDLVELVQPLHLPGVLSGGPGLPVETDRVGRVVERQEIGVKNSSSDNCPRNGQLDKIDALFQGHYSRFTNQPVATFNPT